MKRIYLDYAASTPVDEEVLSAMEPFWREQFANSGAIHQEGVAAAAAIASARVACAEFLHARRPDDVIFTSGATEANNLGFFGLVEAQKVAGKTYEDLHIITTPIEHRSILDGAKALEKKGVAVTYLPVDADGRVNPNDLNDALRPETILVSIQYINSEIGTVQPIKECARVVRKWKSEQGSEMPYFHTDATQAPVYFGCDVQSLGVDMMSLGGQKVYGPKGIGLLYADKDVPLEPMMYGGTRERNLRPGTHPTPLIVGFAKALTIAEKRREEEAARVLELQSYFIDQLQNLGAEPNGSREHRTPNNINVSFPGHDSEFLVLQLDARGIACSAKSACSRGGGSHVVRALGKGEEYATSALRLSLGKETTKEALEYIVEKIKECIAQQAASQPVQEFVV